MTNKKRRLLATATYTLKVVSDGQQGPQGPIGPAGPQGEAISSYDGSFSEGKKFWSTSYTEYIKPGEDVIGKTANTSIYGGKTLKIKNEATLYSKNAIPIEHGKIYKFTFRVRQLQNPSENLANLVYAGATEFSHDGNKLSLENGTYFIVDGQQLPIKWQSQDDSQPEIYDPLKDDQYLWTEFTKYMSTTSRDPIMYAEEIKFPAVFAFSENTKYIKPMFMVNHTQGDGIAEVDTLIFEDVTAEYEAAKESANKFPNDAQKIWDVVTDEGKKQGIFIEDEKLYINGEYINARNLRVIDIEDNLTFGVDELGQITIRPKNFVLMPNKQNQQTMINQLNNNINYEDSTNGIFLFNEKLYINGENIKANSIIGHTITGCTFKGGSIGIGGDNYDAFKVDNNGNLFTKGNVNINNNFIVTSDGDATMDNVVASNIKITSGSLSIGSDFSVASNGYLTATNANISGSINAMSGTIGGFTINNNRLFGYNVGIGSDYGAQQAFWAGSNNASSAPFRVNHDGKLYATGAEITGKVTITSGSVPDDALSDNIVNGIEAGHEALSKWKNLLIGGSNLLRDTSNDFTEISFSGWNHIFPNNIIAWEKDKPLTGRIFLQPISYEVCSMITIRYNNGEYDDFRGNIVQPGYGEYSTITTIVPNRSDIQQIEFSIAHSYDVSSSNTVYFKEAKVEKGNMPTDWSPCPIDISESIDDASKIIDSDGQVVYIKDLLTELEVGINGLVSKVGSLETEFGENGSIVKMKEQITRLIQTTENFTMEFFEKVQETGMNVEEILSYIEFSADGIILGQKNYPIRLVISKDKIKFLNEEEKELAYFSDNKLLIQDAEILKTLQIANYGFLPNAGGSLTIGALR